jgi:hypothetical protein
MKCLRGEKIGWVVVACCFGVLVVTIILVSVFTDPGSCIPSANPQVAILVGQRPRVPGFTHWCGVTFNVSHVGWNKNQSPRLWSRVFMYMSIPYSFLSSKTTSNIQITPYDENNEISPGGLKSTLIGGYFAYNVLVIELEYWGEAPWTLYVGQNQTQKTTTEKSSCIYLIQ